MYCPTCKAGIKKQDYTLNVVEMSGHTLMIAEAACPNCDQVYGSKVISATELENWQGHGLKRSQP